MESMFLPKRRFNFGALHGFMFQKIALHNGISYLLLIIGKTPHKAILIVLTGRPHA
jgi:hypothetical protein